jgi:predicted CoA-binding protein
MSDSRPTIAIIGASQDRTKFGNKAVRAFRDREWDVFPIHPTLAEVEGIKAYPDLASVPAKRLDRVSFYVPRKVGLTLLDAVARKSPSEIWLNPGSESPELVDSAEQLGLNVIQACSILNIGAQPLNY